MKIFLSLTIAILFLKPIIAFSGASHGGGGDATHLDIVAVRAQIYKHCDEWISIMKKYGVTCKALRKSMDSIGETSGLQVEDDSLNQSPRFSSSVNPEIPSISFSRKYWIATGNDTVMKLGVVLHAYFVMLHLEQPDERNLSNNISLRIGFRIFDEKFDGGKIDAPKTIKVGSNFTCPDPKRQMIKATESKKTDTQLDWLRLDMISVRDYIYSHCNEFSSLGRAGISCISLKNKMDEVGIAEKFKVANRVSLNDGVPRSGVNEPSIPSVTLSTEFWLDANSDKIRSVGFVLHEFLGLLEIEKTDDYKISQTVVEELRMRAELGHLDTDFFPPMPAYVSRENDKNLCPNISGLWRMVDEYGSYSNPPGYAIRQESCGAISISGVEFRGRYFEYLFTQGPPLLREVGGTKSGFAEQGILSGFSRSEPYEKIEVTYSANYSNDDYKYTSQIVGSSDRCQEESTYHRRDGNTLIRSYQRVCNGVNIDGPNITYYCRMQ